MSKVLAVFGATSKQGSSVINSILQDSELYQKYKIRAITRDVDSAQSKALEIKGVEVVQGDVSDRSSLERALTGAHFIFAITNPSFRTIADVALEKGAEYIIFSTLPNTTEVSGGKYTKIGHFDAKAKAERYIRSLPVKSAFFSPWFSWKTFTICPSWLPRVTLMVLGSWPRHNSAVATIPMIDAGGETGKFVGVILAEPDKYEGKTFCASTACYSMEDAAAIMSKLTEKTVVYKQISREDGRKLLPPIGQDIMIEAFSYPEEFGYYGPDTEKLVAWAAENARGRASMLEEYLAAHPLKLD